MAHQSKFEHKFQLIQKDIDHLKEIQSEIRQDIRDIRNKKDEDSKIKSELKWKKIGLAIAIVALITSNVWTCNELKNTRVSTDITKSNSSQQENNISKFSKK